MSRSKFEEGKIAFDNEEWVDAIRSLLSAIDDDRHDARSYLLLIQTYEAACEEYGDAELLEQAVKVCRDARKLHLDEKQRALVDVAADRIQERLREFKEEEEE